MPVGPSALLWTEERCWLANLPRNTAGPIKPGAGRRVLVVGVYAEKHVCQKRFVLDRIYRFALLASRMSKKAGWRQ